MKHASHESTGPSRLLIVDDHDLIRQGLSRAFERDQNFVVAGHAGSVAEAMKRAAQLLPDAVVTDVRLPDGSGLDIVRSLRSTQPAMAIVVVSMYAGDEQLFAALDAGASAFVSKEAPAHDVVKAVRQALVSPRSFAAAGFADAMRRRMTSTTPRLSGREREVLGLLAEGLGVTAIAQTLYVSESTAKTHISRIYEKLGAANRTQAIMAAVRAGLLALE